VLVGLTEFGTVGFQKLFSQVDFHNSKLFFSIFKKLFWGFFYVFFLLIIINDELPILINKI
jgi:hypothetical protein